MIQYGLTELEEHGILSPQTRLAIYERLDPMDSDPPNIHIIRGRIALYALERVLPVWKAHLPILGDEDDQLPMMLANAIREVIEGRANLPDMWAYANEQWHLSSSIVEEIFEYHDEVPNTVAYVIETGIKGLLESMGLETLKEVEMWSEEDHMRFTDDAAATAAIVLCGGGDTGIPVDVQKLYEYWRWWLIELVPRAWQGT